MRPDGTLSFVNPTENMNRPVSQLTLDLLVRKRKALRRELLANPNLVDLKIAILGGATTNELADFLEILLLAEGFRCTFYQSEYGKYYEDAVFASPALTEFRPDIVYLHTSSQNIRNMELARIARNSRHILIHDPHLTDAAANVVIETINRHLPDPKPEQRP